MEAHHAYWGFGVLESSHKSLHETTLDRSPRNPEAEFTLTHSTKEAMVMVIAERIGGSISGLKEIALENAKAAAPDARLVFEKERIVNGTKVLNMRIDGSIKGIAFSYFLNGLVILKN